MIYRKFGNLSISALGMGCMRLPVLCGKGDVIDEEETSKMVEYAMSHGVNYYDTARGYHNGNSELVMGKVLSAYKRESFYLASKFPGYDLSNMGKVVEIFNKQLEKCRTEYFDFYLVHNVCELNINQYLDPKYGTMPYLLKMKEEGRIRHLGFSLHGSIDVLKRFFEAYGEHMEFCQLQINWLDWDFQNAKEKVAFLKERNIPVFIMEPLRGGMLVKLAPEYEAKLKELRPDETIPAWSFRYIQSLSDVVVTLSGMSNFEQMKANIETFETEKPLAEAEKQILYGFAKEMLEKTTVPCTGCRYCTTHCPNELDIPRLLELYNEHNFSGGGFIAPMGLGAIDQDKRPDACVGCRSCEAVCPQGIKISEALADFSKLLK